jgi:hypothetical protein
MKHVYHSPYEDADQYDKLISDCKSNNRTIREVVKDHKIGRIPNDKNYYED